MSSRGLAVLPELSARRLAIAREHGRVTVAMAESQTQANRSTIKLHLAKLVKAGHLVQQGIGRGTWYSPTGYE
jgi:predicted HTH transcriptional regulator